MKSIMRHKCKACDGAHDYDQCEVCGHEFCARYWQVCPRCQERIRRDAARMRALFFCGEGDEESAR